MPVLPPGVIPDTGGKVKRQRDGLLHSIILPQENSLRSWQNSFFLLPQDYHLLGPRFSISAQKWQSFFQSYEKTWKIWLVPVGNFIDSWHKQTPGRQNAPQRN